MPACCVQTQQLHSLVLLQASWHADAKMSCTSSTDVKLTLLPVPHTWSAATALMPTPLQQFLPVSSMELLMGCIIETSVSSFKHEASAVPAGDVSPPCLLRCLRHDCSQKEVTAAQTVVAHGMPTQSSPQGEFHCLVVFFQMATASH